ncbi:hypothetical protein [Chryseobacterium indologenes]|uniref:hypothetical protein n=1 Tax=Chryseobacterium indologenes TaxID=253 RepID=UPI000AF7E8B9|nr:hypothetical protein [Chryseobacterium indologenes]
MTDKKAREIIAMCDQFEAYTLSFTAFVKAEMNAFLGGVGTTQNKRKSNSKIKSEQEAKIRAQFRRK